MGPVSDKTRGEKWCLLSYNKIIRSGGRRCIGTAGMGPVSQRKQISESSSELRVVQVHVIWLWEDIEIEIWLFFILNWDLHFSKSVNVVNIIVSVTAGWKDQNRTHCPHLSLSLRFWWQVIKRQLLLWSEGVSMLNTSLACTLIPHCLLIWAQDLTDGWVQRGNGGCVVKSSCRDVKQAHAGASPQVQKEMKYLFDFSFCFFFVHPPSLPSCPTVHYQIY